MIDTNKIYQNYLIGIGGEHEWILSHRNDIPIIINKFSLDQFLLFHIPNHFNRKKIEEYKSRQLYNLPNTPKMLLIPHSENEQEPKLLLCQKAPYNFEKLMHSQSEFSELVKLFIKILSVLEMLTKKYGYFDITENMIRASKGPTPIIWIHEKQIENTKQYPLGLSQPLEHLGQQVQMDNFLIRKLAKMFQQYHSINFRFGYDSKLSFHDAFEHLQSMIKKSSFSELLVLTSKNLTLKNKDRRLTDGKVNVSIPQFLKKQKTCKQYRNSQNCCKIREAKNKTHDMVISEKNIGHTKYESFQDCQISPQQLHKIKHHNTPKARNNFKFKFPEPGHNRINNATQIWYKSDSLFNMNHNQDSILSLDMEPKPFASKQYIDFRIAGNQKRNSQQQIQLNDFSQQNLKQKSEGEQEEKQNTGNHQDSRIDKVSMKNTKGKFRQSGHSTSTTAQYFSINSSGNRKDKSDDDFSTVLRNRQKLVSTFGAKTSKQHIEQDQPSFQEKNKHKLSGKFKIKVSKVIEENEEVLQSPSRHTPRSPSIINGKQNLTQNSIYQGSQFECEVANLLKSTIMEPESGEIQGIEEELNNIFDI